MNPPVIRQSNDATIKHNPIARGDFKKIPSVNTKAAIPPFFSPNVTQREMARRNIPAIPAIQLTKSTALPITLKLPIDLCAAASRSVQEDRRNE